MNWITDWSEISENERYIVCSIAAKADDLHTLYLYKPEIMLGWQVKRLMAKCYAALPMPEFKGLNENKHEDHRSNLLAMDS